MEKLINTNIKRELMKTNLFILFFILLIPSYSNAQQTIYKKAHHDLTPFTGTWIATKDDMRYEITFKKGILKIEALETQYEAEVVFATLVRWYKNGTLIREVKSDTPESILQGFISEKKPLCLGSVVYYDKKNDCCGNGTFTINSAENPQTGKWLHFSSRGIKSDFPNHLDFTKVK